MKKMTKEELKKDGWIPQICKIGTLYFKDDWFGRLNGDAFILYSIDDDMHPIGTALVKEELIALMRQYDKDKILKAEIYLETLKYHFKEKYE